MSDESNGKANKKAIGSFQKGGPGGPGRPVGCIGWRRQLESLMMQPHDDDPHRRTRGELLLVSVWTAAMKGDMQAAKLILDRIDPPSAKLTVDIIDRVQREREAVRRLAVALRDDDLPSNN
jgi:hypothetical protein